jgi:hypothetical protein
LEVLPVAALQWDTLFYDSNERTSDDFNNAISIPSWPILFQREAFLVYKGLIHLEFIKVLRAHARKVGGAKVHLQARLISPFMMKLMPKITGDSMRKCELRQGIVT